MAEITIIIRDNPTEEAPEGIDIAFAMTHPGKDGDGTPALAAGFDMMEAVGVSRESLVHRLLLEAAARGQGKVN